MNLRTTLVLFVLAVAGGAVLWFAPKTPRGADKKADTDRGTLATFKEEFVKDRVRSVVIQHGSEPPLEFARGDNGEWTMKGDWPTHSTEVDKLVERLCSMRSRFAPLPVTDKEDLKKYRLDDPDYVVTLETSDKKTYRLVLSEGPVLDKDNSFFRPLFVRLDRNDEVIRLAPGLLSVLGRPRDFYQKRQLFQSVREARTPDSPERVDRFDGVRVTVENKEKDGQTYVLEKSARGWQLESPSVERLDPDKLEKVREAVADLWAEKFIQGSPADVAAIVGSAAVTDAGLPSAWTSLSWVAPLVPTRKAPGLANWRDWLLVRSGLDKPERILRIRQGSGTVVMHIGRISSTKQRPAPPPRPGMPPDPPTFDEYRFARLENNDQIFEIKADKFKDLFVPSLSLRDTKLARFESKNARKIEVTRDGQKIVSLFRDEGEKEKWKVETPSEGASLASMPAEETKVNELLDKLSALSAQDKESDRPVFAASLAGLTTGTVLDTAAALYPGSLKGLSNPEAFKKPLATVKITVVDDKDKSESKKTKEIVLVVGAEDAINKQLHVRVDDWPRVEQVEDAVLALLRRPALAYRGKLFDFNLADVQRVIVEQGDKKIALEQDANKWRLTVPAMTDADAGKAGQLVTQLEKLEPTEYVTENPDAADLDTKYGLTKAPLSVTVQAGGKLKTLRLGHRREGKMEYYAKLDGSPSVFAVGADLQASLKADALSYLPLQLWRTEPETVKAFRIERGGAEAFDVERREKGWALGKPLNTTASDTAAKAILDVMTNPFCERYDTLTAKDMAKYGLDKPYLKLKLISKGDGDKVQELVIGGPIDKDSKDRYARSNDPGAVFVLRSDVVKNLDRTAIDFVDTLLLNVPLDDVARIESASGESKFALSPMGVWKVVEGPGAPFTVDENALAALRTTLFNLRGDRFVAYGTNLDLAKYGLDKPFATLALTLKEGNPKTKTLTLGDEVKGSPGMRYARLDQSPGIAVLEVADTRVLSRSALDYVDHRVLKLLPEKITEVQRVKGMETLQIAKQDDEWTLVKPGNRRADDKSIENLFAQLADLRAVRVAEYPLKDAKKYGLETASATVTIKATGKDGKPAQHVLTLGDETPDKNGERYAKVDDIPTVFVLPPRIANLLEGSSLVFRSKALARFSDAEKILLERGPRLATVARVSGSWAMTAPLEAKLDNDAVEDFLTKAARLEADELVAEKPADLKPYGLDRPTARWRFQLDNKDVLDLVIGKLDASGKRAYAMLGKGDLVFLLKPDLTKAALGEFREKTVWTMPIDAAQVDLLKLTRGGKTTVLKKSGAIWDVEGKPEAKPALDTVNDTLAALSGLKVERFAVDKGADRKLFGLEPPELVIEAEAGDKKAVLHIGRFEGDSKRAYASLTDKDRSDVFVLSEADTARLTRDLDALSKAIPKKPE